MNTATQGQGNGNGGGSGNGRGNGRAPVFRNPTVWLFCSYLFDWVLCILLLVLFFLLDKVTPFLREFSVEDKSIMYPLKPDTIKVWQAGVIAAAFPAVVILVVAIGVRRSPYDLHNGILGLLVAVLLTTMLTQVIKTTVGTHRPDFLDRCQPRVDNAVPTTDPPMRLWTNAICTNTDKRILDEGSRAFPSGHASTSFAGLTYISLWMAGKMHIFDRRGYSLKPVIVLIPLLGAILVAITRIQDYKHTATQVTWGAIIGILCALFSYHQYYPSLTSRNSQIPYPPRDFSHLVKRDDDPSNIQDQQAREELGMSLSQQQQQLEQATANQNGGSHPGTANGSVLPHDRHRLHRHKTGDQFVEDAFGIRPSHEFIDESRYPYSEGLSQPHSPRPRHDQQAQHASRLLQPGPVDPSASSSDHGHHPSQAGLLEANGTGGYYSQPRP